MDKKQTAVKWLQEQVSYNNGFGILHPSHSEFADLSEIFQQALQMEREQIEEAYMEGGEWDELPQPRFDNYYTQTFKP